MAPLRASSAYWLALTVIAIVQLDTGEIFSLSGFFTCCFGQVYSPETALGGIRRLDAVRGGGLLRVPRSGRSECGASRGRAGPAWCEPSSWRSPALFAASVACKVVLVQLGALDDPELGPYMLSLPPFLDQFALGMALAVLSVWYADREQRPAPLRLVERRPGGMGGSAAGLLGSEHTGWVDRRVRRARGPLRVLRQAPALRGGGPGCAAAGGVRRPRHGLVRRFLASRVLLWLGLISYGLYLWHAAVFHQLGVWGYGEVADSTHRYTWPHGHRRHDRGGDHDFYLVERNALRLKWLVGRRGEPGPPGRAIREPAPVTPGAGTRAG